MGFEFSAFNFYRCPEGWQIVIGGIKFFDKRGSWCILMLNKRKNKPFYYKFCA
jgi:hypothetical protein